MMTEQALLSAFLLGLLGSSHCVGMCGGISGAMALNVQGGFLALSSRLFAFNIGRVVCYSTLGAVIGLAGAQVGHVHGLMWMRVIAGLLLIAMGLYVAQWWMGLTVLEKAGQYLWKFISPLAQRFMGMRTLTQTFAAGVLWGFLPCGLVYSVLAWAALSGSWQSSAWTMFYFGMGTVPAMVATGFGSGALKQFLQQKNFRQVVALLLIVFGVWTIVMATQH